MSSIVAMLVSCVVITLSTLYRMYLYEQAYGLSVLRLFVAIFSLWVFGVLLLLGYKLYRHKTESFFANTALILGLSIWCLFLLSNPHALIAKNNFNRFLHGQKLDATYLQELSTDAFPFMVSQLQQIPLEERHSLSLYLQAKKDALGTQTDWQSWNLSTHKAKKLLNDFNYTPSTNAGDF